MKINLNEIEDDFESHWWQYIRVSSDFAFINNVRNLDEFDVEDDDILIHKQTERDEEYGRTYVVKRYHQILDGEAFLIDGKDARDMMELKLIEYIKNNDKLPFGMEVEKVYKNKKVKIKFTINEYDSFTLKIDSKDFSISPEESNPSEQEIKKFFDKLPNISENPLGSEETSHEIKKMRNAPVVEAVANETGGKVYIESAKIDNIDKRKSVFREYETIFYLLHVVDGKVKPNDSKNAYARDFEEINAKCSENAMEKYKLEEGDRISFKGKFKKHRKHGSIVQNIRKFVKD